MYKPTTQEPASGTVLVTGASGFLGSYIARAVADSGKRVVAYDVVAPTGVAAAIQQSALSPIETARGQITDVPRMLAVVRHFGVTDIVHAAGFVDVEVSIDQAYHTYNVNTLGSINIFEIARLEPIRRVVQISSNAVYQDRQYEPVDERHPVTSLLDGCYTHYGASKLAAEIIGLTYATLNNVDLVVLRPSAIYGFGMRVPLNLQPLVDAAVRGRSCRLPTGGKLRRDYTYVKDVVQGVVGALNVPKEKLSQRIFNIASGKTHPATDVVEIVKEIIPGADVSIGSEMTPFEESDMRKRAALDCSSARSVLGYVPQYDLRRGIQEYIQTLRSYIEKEEAA